MKKKMILSAIVMAVLAVGLICISCEEPITDGEVTIVNSTDNYTITKIKLWGEGGTDIIETVSLTSGQEKTWTLPTGSFTLSLDVVYTGSLDTSDYPLFDDNIRNKSVNLIKDPSERENRKLYLKEKIIKTDDPENIFHNPQGRYLSLELTD